MTDEEYESWRRDYWYWEDYVVDQSIKKKTAISKAIEIVIVDQVCDRDLISISSVCHASTRLLPSRESDMWRAMSKTWGYG